MKRILSHRTACYLLPCAGGGYLLVDTGVPAHYRALVDAMAAQGVAPADVRCVLLTHHHYDHSGGAAELLRDSGARLIVHRLALPFLETGTSRLAPGITPAVRLLARLFLRGGRRYRSVRRPAAVCPVDGDDSRLLRELGIAGDILHTPGHTPDGLSVLLDDGRAFVGDLAMRFPLAPTNPWPVFAEDPALVRAGWRKLADRGAKVLYPAHGGPVDVRRLPGIPVPVKGASHA